MKRLCKILVFVLGLNLIMVSNIAKATTTDEYVEIKESLTQEQYIKVKEQSDSTLQKSYKANSGEQLIKEAIYNEINNYKSEIDLTNYIKYFKDDLRRPLYLYFEVLYEHPEIFYTDLYIGYSGTQNSVTGEVLTYKLKTNLLYDINTCKSMRQKLDYTVKSIKDRYLDTSYGQLKNEYIVHDYIIENCSYDPASVSQMDTISHTAYGSLVNGVAVCDGYSKGAKLLLNQVGIECGIITSDRMNHAWNYVKIDGDYYQFDLTWDDTLLGDSGVNVYTYFNLNDAQMRRDHTSWDENGIPKCTSTKFNFLRSYTDVDDYTGKPFVDYNLTRSENKLYYTHIGEKLLYSMDLNGANKKVESSNFDFNIIVGERNNIYYLKLRDNGKDFDLHRYNVTNKTDKIIYTGTGDWNYLYKQNDIIFINYDINNVEKVAKISVKMDEDVNRDGLINIADLALIGNYYNSKKDDSNYKPTIDVNNDGIIDIFDIVRVAQLIK